MEVVRSVRIKLAIDDMYEHIANVTKQQLIQKFRILLQRKQIEVNEKIEQNSSEYLLVLQKKMLIIQRKQQQIINLNNKITSTKNQIQQLANKYEQCHDDLIEYKNREISYEKKIFQFNNIYKQQKFKKQSIKKQHQILSNNYNLLKQQYQFQARNHKKIKDQKIHWQSQTQFLLNNLLKKQQQQIQSKVALHTFQSNSKIEQLQQKRQEDKKKYQNCKQKYHEFKKYSQHLKKVIQSLNKQLQIQKDKKSNIQSFTHQNIPNNTDTNKNLNSIPIKQMNQISIQTDDQQQPKFLQQQTQTQQIESIIIQKQIQSQQSIKIQSQKQQQQQQCQQLQQKIQYRSNSTQTIFNPLSHQQQQALIASCRNVITTTNRIIQLWKNKYYQVQSIHLLRPSRPEDRLKIQQLQKQFLDSQMKSVQNDTTISKLQYLNFELNKQILHQNNFIQHVNMQQVSIKNILKNNNNEEQNKLTNSKLLTFKINSNEKLKKFIPYSLRNNSDKIIDDDSNKLQINNKKFIHLKTSFQRIRTQSDQNIQKNSSFHKLEQLGTALFQKGITFRQSSQLIFKKQIPQTRKYKKFKSLSKSIYY